VFCGAACPGIATVGNKARAASSQEQDLYDTTSSATDRTSETNTSDADARSNVCCLRDKTSIWNILPSSDTDLVISAAFVHHIPFCEVRVLTFSIILSGFHRTLIRPYSASEVTTVWHCRNSVTIILSLHFNSHFPGEPGLNSVY